MSTSCFFICAHLWFNPIVRFTTLLLFPHALDSIRTIKSQLMSRPTAPSEMHILLNLKMVGPKKLMAAQGKVAAARLH
jgi:hypothetical protein